MTNQKKLIYLIFALVLVSGVIFFLREYLNKKFTNNNSKDSNQVIPLAEKYPAGITDEWILEPNAIIISKDTSAGGTGVQGSLLYESKLTQSKAASDYEAFLKKKGFTITYTENKKTGIISINGEHGDTQAFIVVDQNDISKKVTVDVTVVTKQVSTQPTK